VGQLASRSARRGRHTPRARCPMRSMHWPNRRVSCARGSIPQMDALKGCAIRSWAGGVVIR
jgi:hypothetical protein